MVTIRALVHLQFEIWLQMHPPEAYTWEECAQFPDGLSHCDCPSCLPLVSCTCSNSSSSSRVGKNGVWISITSTTQCVSHHVHNLNTLCSKNFNL
jgi:hypothetical protein